MDELKNFLTQVGGIVQLNAEMRKGKEERGELFNVFEVLKLEYSETRTHSAFLAALLNPKEKHGGGDRFLRAFISTIDGLNNFEFDTKDANVRMEEYIGNINNDVTEGGRIDILIKSADSRRAIIIENKIYAGDQKKQLVRYANYAKKYSGGYRLLYLNLFRNEASDYSIKEEKSGKMLQAGTDYFVVGYNKEITNWLDACIAEAAQLPIIRETIVQYQNLIKTLTNQNMEKEYNKKVLDAMLGSTDAVAAITSQLDNWRATIIKKLLDNLQKYADEKGFKFENDLFNKDGCLNYGKSRKINFSKEEWTVSSITIECEKCNYSTFAIGVCCRKNMEEQQSVFGRSTTKSWPYGWKYFDKYCNWTYEIMPDMNKGDVAEYIKGLVNETLKIIEEKKLSMP